ncbi:hypothetical protein C8250_020760 [Streptomyces sp. So13.3]|uniref:hypothetical protein n=1 Tax=Streptomyces TaxID=1883 RepID=UPI0011070449|nr:MULTISPECIES: hypothetical protein [Streptomyces]MCZ4099511.1 hypothetical protein [Streptomyces sp. H39-C1]QNA74027.1 hypothetical protein C8250_020760 [Streptomyces sp. So13.3]
MAAANFCEGEYVTDEAGDLGPGVVVRDLDGGLLRVRFEHYEATVNTNRLRPATDDETRRVTATEEHRTSTGSERNGGR